MAIRALSRQEFDRFGSTCVMLNDTTHRAVEWFADDAGLVLGAIVYHDAALDWSFVVLTRDTDGEFRALGPHAELRSLDDARQLLSVQMEIALALPAESERKIRV